MKKLLLLSLLLFFFLFPQKTFADEKFTTSYKTTYVVNDNANTRVTGEFNVKNNTTRYYVSSYKIQTGFSDVKNVKITDEDGNIKYNLVQNNKGSELVFKFNKNVVGIGDIKKFSVSYDTSQVARKTGKLWEINIPGIQDQEDYSSFSAEVRVPSNFGQATIIKPEKKDVIRSGNNLTFSKSDLGNSGISITYGQDQVYDFSLSYHLQNKNIIPETMEIAIPSNNNYQNVMIRDINPKPKNVYIDQDGNWLAQFKVSPASKQDVVVSGTAQVFYKPKQENLTEDQKNLYLKGQKYWEVDDPTIKSLAKSLKTPEAIYNYVVDSLRYDSGRVTENQVRSGALGVLSDKDSAVCLEFTDLFVTLARAAGIPAREVQGYANTENSANRPLSLSADVLHAWPEYYDFNKKTWVMVDPTWQNTTGGTDYFKVLDFDHFAFVINGESSIYPVPAGGYKLTNSKDKQDVFVGPGTKFQNITPSLLTSTDPNKKFVAGLPIESVVTIKNVSGVAAPGQTLLVSSSSLSPNSQSLYFDSIPPYGERSVAIRFNSRPLLTNEAHTIKITIGNQTIEKQIIIAAFYKHIRFYILIGGVLIGIFTIIIFKVARRGRSVQVS